VKPRIRIAFQHFWPGFDAERHFGFLRDRFELAIADDPEVVVFSVFSQGRKLREMPRLRTRARRIFCTGENVAPDMAHCDFAFGFVHEERVGSERYRRLPNYVLRLWANGHASEELIKPELSAPELLAEKTRFCNFVYSNPHCEARNRFFEKLSRYKRVDAAGPLANNLGWTLPRSGPDGGVGAKLDFIRRYKFTIAFENESSPGYTTEKVVEPMLVRSLPIHWGDPEVARDFNPASFVGLRDPGESLDELVERVVAADRDDALYAQYLKEPWLAGNRLPAHLRRAEVVEAFARAFA
jgi:hypothetical protein